MRVIRPGFLFRGLRVLDTYFLILLFAYALIFL